MEKESKFSTCANPECAAPFNFREGRLFRFFRDHPVGNAASVNAYSLKHLWLCRECTELYTLEYQDGRGFLIPLAAAKPFAAVISADPAVRNERTTLVAVPPARKRAKVKVMPKRLQVKRTATRGLEARSVAGGG